MLAGMKAFEMHREMSLIIDFLLSLMIVKESSEFNGRF
jgi:hypothetical protein